MIQTDQRRRLSHSITLHDGKPQPLEKQLRLAPQRRPAANECPEANSKEPVNPPELPCSSQKRPPGRSFVFPAKPPSPSTRIDFTIDLGPYELEHSWDGDQHRGLFSLHGS